MSAAAPTRLRPLPGTLLGIADVQGAWRACAGFGDAAGFALTWSTAEGPRFALLADFDAAAQDELIAQCREADRPTLRMPRPCMGGDR
jgi:hypothetical protein